MKFSLFIFIFGLVMKCLFVATLSQEIKLIELNKFNLITLRGEIDEQTSNEIIHKINKFNHNTMYFYISSPGGSVIDGIHIIDQLKTLYFRDIRLICIADFAASMAFTIFQSCPTRYIRSSSILMQHQMSLGTKGNLYNMNNYLDFINSMDTELDKIQADRLGLAIDTFKTRITTDWWIFGSQIINNNAADLIVNVLCNPNIIDQNETIKKSMLFFDIELTYSLCPLIREPITLNYNISSDFNESKKQIQHIIKSTQPGYYILNSLNKN